jgi:hypothetical protein
LAGLTACSPKPREYSEADKDFLASDAHVSVAGISLVVPFIALNDYIFRKQSFSLDRKRDRAEAKKRFEEFRNAAANATTAPKIDTLEIVIGVFGQSDKFMVDMGFCSRLKRKWAKSVCVGYTSPILAAVPSHYDRFYLFDNRNPNSFRNHWTVGNERVSDQIPFANLTTGTPSVICDKNSSSSTTFCTASVLIKDHLAAVWSVSNFGAETPAQEADRQARAITALVLDGFGPEENFERLLEVTCRSRNPKSTETGKPDPCGSWK